MIYTTAYTPKKNSLVVAAVIASASSFAIGGVAMRLPVSEYSIALFKDTKCVSVSKSKARSDRSMRKNSRAAVTAKARRERFLSQCPEQRERSQEITALIEDAQSAVVRNFA